MADSDKFSSIFNMLTSFISDRPGPARKRKETPEEKESNLTQPANRLDFQERVKSFEIGKWSIFNLSPLLCAQYGWRCFREDVLECCTCKVYLPTSIPPFDQRSVYNFAIGKLKRAVKDHHKTWCGWRTNPSPQSFLAPPKNLSVHYLKKLRENTASLALLENVLPLIETQDLLKTLDLNVTSLQCLIGCNEEPNQHQIDAAILSICGWKYENIQYMKCEICLRSVGFWNFYSKDEADLYKLSQEASRGRSDLVTQITDATAACDTSLSAVQSQDCPIFLADEECPIGREVELGHSGMAESPSKTCKEPSLFNQDYGVTVKSLFRPLNDHRSWCGWVTNITDDSSEETKGYMVLPPQLERLVPDIPDSLVASPKYSQNVNGLRAVRTMLKDSLY